MTNENREIKPIETYYKGFRFRSRLEARWAMFFDCLGIDWEYEKEGYDLGALGWYLPDFWIPAPLYCVEQAKGKAGYWVEIKPNYPSLEEVRKCESLTFLTGHTTILLYGSCALDKFGTICFEARREQDQIKGINMLDHAMLEISSPPPHFFLAHKFFYGQKDASFDSDLPKLAMMQVRKARF